VAAAGDVGDRAVADGLVARAVDTFGRLDVMVTNAGVLRDAVLWKMTDEDFDLVVRTHLRGTFMCARAAAIRLREQAQGGRLIVVGSPAGQYGNFGQTNYAAAKAGIVALARTWALELARAEITVNAIVPTAWTAMTATIPIYKPLVARVAAGEPLPAAVRREHAIGHPEDCAGLVVFLASAAAAGVSGQAIGVGGDRLCLYSHPAELVTELRAGGWDADAIAAVWPERFAAQAQPVGIRLPKLEIA
jgi:NAD(P)-dependent dehydrogenase (short-subunit alcohol dehydrogenase family)